MTAEQFTLRWVCLLALLAGLIALSPVVMGLLNSNPGCFGSESGCRDMAQMFAHYGRSMILIVVLIPLLVIVATRALTAGVFAWAFPFALLMVAGALPLLHQLGTPGAQGWTRIAANPALVPLLFLLVLFIALGSESEEGDGKLWRVLMALVAAVTVFVISAIWLPGLALMPYVGQVAAPIGPYLGAGRSMLGIASEVGYFANACLVAFTLAAAGMMVSARHARG